MKLLKFSFINGIHFITEIINEKKKKKILFLFWKYYIQILKLIIDLYSTFIHYVIFFFFFY